MIGFDTNVLIRFLVKDDLKQHSQALKLVKSHVDLGEKIAVSAVVLQESIWVLSSVYEYSRVDIAAVIQRILETAEFVVQCRTEALQALVDFRSSKAEFSDCLLGRIYLSMGCSKVATFDRGASKIGHFYLLKG